MAVWRLTEFGGVALPIYNTAADFTGGRAESPLLNAVTGVHDPYSGLRVLPRRAQFALQGIYAAEYGVSGAVAANVWVTGDGDTIVDGDGNRIVWGLATPGGPVVTATARSQLSALRALIGQMKEHGAAQILVDGAINRIASAAPSVTGATILATGAPVGPLLDDVIRKTVFRCNILETPVVADRLLLEAARIASSDVPNLHVIFVGDGELRAELEAHAAALGMSAAVTFAGWQSDLPSVYADLDATIVSSTNEGTPACLIEAMASGCPVIATRVGGVPDMISPGETGQLVPSGDARALAAAIVRLVKEPEQARRMANQARGEALVRYDEQRLLTDMDRLYGQLARDVGLKSGNSGRDGEGARG